MLILKALSAPKPYDLRLLWPIQGFITPFG